MWCDVVIMCVHVFFWCSYDEDIGREHKAPLSSALPVVLSQTRRFLGQQSIRGARMTQIVAKGDPILATATEWPVVILATRAKMAQSQ